MRIPTGMLRSRGRGGCRGSGSIDGYSTEDGERVCRVLLDPALQSRNISNDFLELILRE